jgi:aminopeptidase N
VSNTPAVGVGAGRARGRSASVPYGWLPAFRSTWFVIGLTFAVLWAAIGGSPVAAAPNSLRLRATYDVAAYIRWSRGTIDVSSTARVKNTTDMPVTRLTFNLVPLRTGRAKILKASVDGRRVDPNEMGQSIVVRLPKPLKPGRRTLVTIRYRARFDATTGEKESLLIQAQNIVTAYRWIPWLSRNEPFAVPNFGETWVTAVSPRVRVRLRSDVPLKFATSGRYAGKRGGAQVFVATNVRDFNFSASPDYKVKRFKWRGTTVRVYYLTENVNRLVTLTVRAMKHFTAKIGPYAYPQLSVAETPAGSGMESPALTWISSTVGPSRLPYMIVHEVAHQWFYGAVGNNQAMQPFLDEALADFLTRDVLHNFRASECKKAPLDGSVYDYSAKCYFETLYVQGSRYLAEYRREVGSSAFWRGLRAFYAAYQFKISGTRTLFDYLDAASGFDSQRHADRFPTLYP